MQGCCSRTEHACGTGWLRGPAASQWLALQAQLGHASPHSPAHAALHVALLAPALHPAALRLDQSALSYKQAYDVVEEGQKLLNFYKVGAAQCGLPWHLAQPA